jgi:hypothetical protein
METKICSKCKVEKSISEFYKYYSKSISKLRIQSRCKLCLSEDNKSFYANNVEVFKIKKKEFYHENKESELARRKTHYINNHKRELNRMKEYREKNEEYFQEYRKKYQKNYENNRYKNDPEYKLSKNIRRRVSLFLQLNNVSKTNKTFDIVGCTPQQLKEHIQLQFKDNMSWDNYGYYGWHIDHIIPLSSAKTKDEIYTLCHYSNLQPLWGKENIKKGGKIITNIV